MYSIKYKYPYHVPGGLVHLRHFDTVLLLIRILSLLHCDSSQIVLCLDAIVYFHYDHAWEPPSWLGLWHSKFKVDYCGWMLSPITSITSGRKSRAKFLLHHFNCCSSSSPAAAAVSHCLLCCVLFSKKILSIYYSILLLRFGIAAVSHCLLCCVLFSKKILSIYYSILLLRFWYCCCFPLSVVLRIVL